jgi:predicted ArsR family transcriptional regulator
VTAGAGGTVPRQEQARALGDPTRHRIFEYVAAAGRDVDVAELTAHTGLHHNAVRQHLAKLVAAGLVDEALEERRAGPGRRRLVYRAAAGTAAPDGAGTAGAYERLASWLTEAVATGDTPPVVGRRAGELTARPLAARDVTPVERLRLAMEAHGFVPSLRRRAGSTEIVLGRCPYASAVLTDAETVCSLHLGLAEGAAAVIDGVQVDGLVPHDPRRAGCRLLVTEEEPGPRAPRERR